MVILGGLEIVVGGYLVHRHYKNKNEKKRLEEEAQQRRHNTFPGAKPDSYGSYAPPPPTPHQQPIIPQQKFACYAPQQHPQPQFQPQPVQHTQSFNIPRRPVPQRQPPRAQQPPQILIQPLQRSDSFATISRMPIANGYRPSNEEADPPGLPPRRHVSNLSPIPQNSPYSNAGFSVSTPAIAPSHNSPTQYGSPHMGRNTVDDNWETYGHSRLPHYTPSESTALGEHDPPPPYRP